MKRYEAMKQRGIIEQATQSLDDKTASEGVGLFPAMKYDGSLIAAGTRINWNSALKMAAADLWDTLENTPDNAPALWQDIAYREGCRIIPAVITATEAFAKGERGWWGGELYVSLLDGNVYTPEQYPDGWALV